MSFFNKNDHDRRNHDYEQSSLGPLLGREKEERWYELRKHQITKHKRYNDNIYEFKSSVSIFINDKVQQLYKSS